MGNKPAAVFRPGGWRNSSSKWQVRPSGRTAGTQSASAVRVLPQSEQWLGGVWSTIFDDIVDHIATCAPCFEEYNHQRRRQRLRNAGLLLLSCVGLLALGLLWRHGPAERPYPRESAAKQSPAPALTATLDYRNWTTERSEQSRPRPTEPPHLTRGRFDITIMLPIGTEDGSFTVQFRTNNNESVAEVTGTATWNGTAEALKIRADLRNVRRAVTPSPFNHGTRQYAFTRWYWSEPYDAIDSILRVISDGDRVRAAAPTGPPLGAGTLDRALHFADLYNWTTPARILLKPRNCSLLPATSGTPCMPSLARSVQPSTN